MTIGSLHDVAAPAKLNLFLHVVGRRDDGYHLLESLVVLIDWCDTLHFESRRDGRLARHDLGAALPQEDLCLRAARRLQAASATPLGADISIIKRLPWGAGLGGGSSDAASTLLALNRLWGLNWPRARLLAIALELGADVPFFVGGRNALMQGIGERLTPVAVPVQWLAVVKPAAALETRAVFSSPLLIPNPRAAILESFAANADQNDADKNAVHWSIQAGMMEPGFGRNDLQAAAQAECPEVAKACEVLRRKFGNSRMTGSGSAVFATAGSGDGPEPEMSLDLAPGWQGRMCRSLPEHPLVGWAAN